MLNIGEQPIIKSSKDFVDKKPKAIKTESTEDTEKTTIIAKTELVQATKYQEQKDAEALAMLRAQMNGGNTETIANKNNKAAVKGLSQEAVVAKDELVEEIDNEDKSKEKSTKNNELNDEVLKKTVIRPIILLSDLELYDYEKDREKTKEEVEKEVEDVLKEFDVKNLEEAFFSKDFSKDIVGRIGQYFQYHDSVRPGYENFSKIVVNLLEKDLKNSGKIISQEFRSLGKVIELNVDSFSKESQEKLVKIAEKEVENYGMDTERIFQYAPRTAELLYESSPTVRKELENVLSLQMEDGNMFYVGKVLTRGTMINSKLAEFAKSKLDNFIEEKYGLKSDMILPYNINKHKPPDFRNFAESLEVMGQIEKQRPGGVKFLNDNFGIKEFLRYPPEVLIAQIDEQGIDQPYGILVYPRSDHNDAFDGDERIIKKLFDQTRNKHGIKIFEAGGKFSLAKILVKMNKMYGDKNKIAYMLLGGHGTKYKVELGEALKAGTLYRQDLYGRAAQKIKNFFVENPTIILESCSTGEEGGIGQQLSKEFGANVIAPNKPTSLKKIQVDYSKNGSPLFSVEYRDNDTATEYKRGIKS